MKVVIDILGRENALPPSLRFRPFHDPSTQNLNLNRPSEYRMVLLGYSLGKEIYILKEAYEQMFDSEPSRLHFRISVY